MGGNSIGLIAATVAAPFLAPITLPALQSRKNFQASRNARKQQESLLDQRKQQLATEASERAAAKKRAETMGSRVGFGRAGQGAARSAFSSFGEIAQAETGFSGSPGGRSTIFGN